MTVVMPSAYVNYRLAIISCYPVILNFVEEIRYTLYTSSYNIRVLRFMQKTIYIIMIYTLLYIKCIALFATGSIRNRVTFVSI